MGASCPCHTASAPASSSSQKHSAASASKGRVFSRGNHLLPLDQAQGQSAEGEEGSGGAVAAPEVLERAPCLGVCLSCAKRRGGGGYKCAKLYRGGSAGLNPVQSGNKGKRFGTVSAGGFGSRSLAEDATIPDRNSSPPLEETRSNFTSIAVEKRRSFAPRMLQGVQSSVSFPR